jgi:hypothetical protein
LPTFRKHQQSKEILNEKIFVAKKEEKMAKNGCEQKNKEKREANFFLL